MAADLATPPLLANAPALFAITINRAEETWARFYD
jgi:hypothetical protein